MADMQVRGDGGSVVMLACDPGDRYLGTYYSDSWLAESGFDLAPYSYGWKIATRIWVFPI
jgi:cysteine synthase A